MNPVLEDAKTWDAEFTEEQINSYVQEDLESSGISKTLPKEIQDPRIATEPQRLRLAFRYGNKPWQSVITIDLRARLVDGERNVVILDLLGLHAGLLPVNSQSILERISAIARDNHLDLKWYRHDNHPVAVLRFQSGVQLRCVELLPEGYRIRAKSLASLRHDKMPDAIILKLNPLKNKFFATREQLANELGGVLAKEELERYQDLVLKHAQQHKGLYIGGESSRSNKVVSSE